MSILAIANVMPKLDRQICEVVFKFAGPESFKFELLSGHFEMQINVNDIQLHPSHKPVVDKNQDYRLLRESIKDLGLFVPITVMHQESDKYYTLIDGLSRLEACKELGHKYIDAKIHSGKDPWS